MNRRKAGMITIAVILVCAIFVACWYWPWYVEHSLRELGWRGVNINSGRIDCSGSIRKGRLPFGWPVRYKPEWTNLYIEGCILTIRDGNDLARARHINQLFLDGGGIEPGALEPLTRLPELTHIGFVGFRPERAVCLRELGASRSLESIYIHSNNTMGKDVFAAMAEIKTLRRVIIDSVVTAEEFEPLARLPNLRVLIAYGLEPSPGLIPIFQRMPQLEELGLGGDNQSYYSIAHPLHAACPKLRIVPSPDGSNDTERIPEPFETRDKGADLEDAANRKEPVVFEGSVNPLRAAQDLLLKADEPLPIGELDVEIEER